MKRYEGTVEVEVGVGAVIVLKADTFVPDDAVTVIATADLRKLIETVRLACGVALGDLMAHGMPPDASTGRLLQAARSAAVAVYPGPISNEIYDLARLAYPSPA